MFRSPVFGGFLFSAGVSSGEKLASAYADFLCRRSWHWFVTLTFRPSAESRSGGMHPEKADKAFRVLVSKINRHLHGTRWYKRPETQIVWARGQEFHKSGRVHFHALFAHPSTDLNSLTRRMDWVDWWWREFGIARIERPQSQADVAGYVSKYVSKEGEVDFSPNFGRVVPPVIQFRDASPPSRISDIRHPAQLPCTRGVQDFGRLNARLPLLDPARAPGLRVKK